MLYLLTLLLMFSPFWLFVPALIFFAIKSPRNEINSKVEEEESNEQN